MAGLGRRGLERRRPAAERTRREVDGRLPAELHRRERVHARALRLREEDLVPDVEQDAGAERAREAVRGSQRCSGCGGLCGGAYATRSLQIRIGVQAV